LTRRASTSDRTPVERRWALRLLLFLVKMCRRPCFLYRTFPPVVTLNRLAADFLVFILGMIAPSFCAAGNKIPLKQRIHYPMRDTGYCGSFFDPDVLAGERIMLIIRPSIIAGRSTTYPTPLSVSWASIRSRTTLPKSV